jgi:integrase
MSRDLRRVLVDLRDAATIKGFERGEPEIPGLVFPSTTGSTLNGVNVYHRDLLPCVQGAGLRRITFHALRHCYASHPIQVGASLSLSYVKEQMGHTSIQVTADIYGHLIPGADIAWADMLDPGTTRQFSATQLQPMWTPMRWNLKTLVGPQGFEPWTNGL